MGLNPFKSIEKSIKKGFNKLGDDIRRSFKKLGGEIEGGIKRTGGKIDRSIKRVGQEVEGGVKKAGREIEGGLKSTGKKIEGDLNKAGNQIKKDFEKLPKQVEKLAQDALQEIGKAITKQGLTKMRNAARRAMEEMQRLEKSKPALVDAINACGFEISIGPLTLEYAGFYARSEELVTCLDSFVSKPPAFRRKDILGLIEAIGPTSMDFGASVELALVVGSKELGVGGKLKSVPLKLGTELADILLEKLGVPA